MSETQVRSVFFRKFGRGIGFAVFSIGIIYGSYMFIKTVFTIRTIAVSDSRIEVEIDRSRISTNLLFFPSEKIRSLILSENPQLENLEIKKQFPNTLILIPILRAPTARLVVGTRIMTVDHDGILLSDASDSHLPLISVPGVTAGVGDSVHDRRILQSLAFIQIEKTLAITELTAFDTTSVRARCDKTDILFTQDQDIRSVVDTLQTLLTGFRIKGTMPTLIDLRFDKPIIKI